MRFDDDVVLDSIRYVRAHQVRWRTSVTDLIRRRGHPKRAITRHHV
ncbi:MAG: hypothetical protein WKF73_09810 [Nocardioidaceae bacterium]